jgi:hypothetical protein
MFIFIYPVIIGEKSNNNNNNSDNDNDENSLNNAW